MDVVHRRMPWPEPDPGNTEPLLTREWLLTNGLGGYASGTVAGVATRRYHGLLVAALPAPHGRTVMLNHLTEQVRLPDGSLTRFGGAERAAGSLDLHGACQLKEFHLDAGIPCWRYEVGGVVLERRVLLVHRQNTVHIHYRLADGDGPVRLWIQPLLHFRPHDAPVGAPLPGSHVLTAVDGRYQITDGSDLPPLRMTVHGLGAAFTLEGKRTEQILYRIEASRGYDSTGNLWSPGYFRIDLARRQGATLVASTEPWETILALSPEEAEEAERLRLARLIEQAPPEARAGLAGELVLAAEQFIFTPAGRVEEAARARAAGDEVRSVIAGYHWFTDWGRDAMISLEGLTLCTGRAQETGYILRTFAYYIRDGLMPNMFPEGEKEGLYHTADATLWFFHAVHRYLQATGDRATLRLLLPKFRNIVACHVRGTRFGIHVDPTDGLLRQGQEGFQLTWMDAKVGDWVVTPRRGKAVEINALWFNALRLLEGWLREEGDDAAAIDVASRADHAKRSFNRRFWNQDKGYLYDVVDGEKGDDDACRPNQVFAISLNHPVLDRERWDAVLDVVRDRLATPVGLRSLAPGHPDYKPQYYGDLRSRDAAYHQGTVWAWLVGPFVDAWLKAHPEDRAGAREFLSGFAHHMGEACVGSISEIFDADPPYAPRGCIAQAWSVAEVLRAWLKTAL
jgi:predicted glycogen debranching enzyme